MTDIAPNWAVTDVVPSPNYSPGRPDGNPNQIVIHHWGTFGQLHDAVVRWLTRPDGDSSAHYVVSAGRVTQLVSDNDRAWHAGASGNPRGIGIECRPEMDAADFEEVARTIAAIRSEHGPLPLAGHRDHMQTECPGRWYAQLAALDARARQIAGDTTPAPAVAAVATAKAVDGQELLEVDGIAGARTIARWQQVMNTPITGTITEPSQLIEAVQHWLNQAVPGPVLASLTGAARLDEDGYEGPKTVKALQWWLWHNVPGLTGGCDVWECYAEDGNNIALSDWCDGIRGEATNAVLQEALNRSHYYAGALMKG